MELLRDYVRHCSEPAEPVEGPLTGDKGLIEDSLHVDMFLVELGKAPVLNKHDVSEALACELGAVSLHTDRFSQARHSIVGEFGYCRSSQSTSTSTSETMARLILSQVD